MHQHSLLAALLLATREIGDDALADLGTLEAAVEAGIRNALVGPVADAIRRANLPPYLTRQQLAELTGWSLRKVDYLKAERRIPYIRRGRSVLFPTAEVEQYLNEGLVLAKGRPP
ncbi:MAG: excisionase family DNA-binding protein [Bacteroidota bacterium]